jgi:S-adenosylmethionine:tRNA ribosyltransferase-isomerase
MDINLFDFELPETCIALRPVNPRDHARQLIVRPQHMSSPRRRGSTMTQSDSGQMGPRLRGGDTVFEDKYVYNLVDELRAGDLLVFNDTRVIPSRLFGTIGAAKVEVTLHKRIDTYSWWAFMKNARRAAVDKSVDFNSPSGLARGPLTARDPRVKPEDLSLKAKIKEKLDDGQVLLEFTTPSGCTMEQALVMAGQMPLPPYIASKRAIDITDEIDYQTIYAKREGAVAAPTAGLHFTPELLAALKIKGVRMGYVTLHVGAGTFLPMKVQDTKDHKMHAEWGEITSELARTVNETHENGDRVVAVGTTSLRLLESAATPDGILHPFCGDTAIFITPGYKFRAVDMLMTNFHLPKSTLFMLVSAFAGLNTMRTAYAHAVKTGYRFYSYGDSSLLYRAG